MVETYTFNSLGDHIISQIDKPSLTVPDSGSKTFQGQATQNMSKLRRILGREGLGSADMTITKATYSSSGCANLDRV